jgi:hypothetical protein
MPNSTTSSSTGSLSGGSDKLKKPAMPDQETLRSDAGAVIDEAKSVAGKVADEAMGQVNELAETAKAQAADAAQKFKGMASEQKDLLAAQIGGVADAMDRVAGELETNNGASAHYARAIAENAEKLSSTIRDNDVDQILEIAQDFGRRQPAAFMGAAALLGFAASRFLLASAKRREEQAMADAPMSSDYDMDPTGTSSTYQGGSAAGGYDGAR